jgi:hypothetical protein
MRPKAKPQPLWTLGPIDTALIGGREGGRGSGVEGGTPSQEGAGHRRPAVVGQGSEQRIFIDQVSRHPAGGVGGIPDQVIALARD